MAGQRVVVGSLTLAIALHAHRAVGVFSGLPARQQGEGDSENEMCGDVFASVLICLSRDMLSIHDE